MKLRHLALLALLGTSIAAPVASQPAGNPGMGPGMGSGQGMGPAAGRPMRFSFNKDNTPGWALMSAEERAAHRDKMHAAKSYEECKAAQAEHHAAMEARAKDKGVTLPMPQANGCDRMKSGGFFK